ncbi:hypothetical protein Cni_G12245 [Canna indica]|uniref:Uncharacterized protein n=1 Tax=Canna indica TaxID=4628 RepID=A0AAQ3QCJ3_9LILI|nr:hypothetical protein Cni_G12245 [Canna indica]
MGACASKSKAVNGGERAPLTLEEPAEITKIGEAEQKQEEKEAVDDAKEAGVTGDGGGEEGENNRKSLGVLMRETEAGEAKPPLEQPKVEHPAEQVEHPATTEENEETAKKVETKEEEEPKEVDLLENSVVIAKESVVKVDSEEGTVIAGLSIAAEDQSADKVELDDSRREEEKLNPAIVAKQSLIAELKTGIAAKEQPTQKQYGEDVELDSATPQISHKEAEQLKAVEYLEKPVLVAEQSVEKVESGSDIVIVKTSTTVIEQPEEDQISKKVELEDEKPQISHKGEEKSNSQDIVEKPAIAPNQHMEKVEFVQETVIAEPTTVLDKSVQEQPLERIEVDASTPQISQEQEEKSKAEEYVDKVGSEIETVITEIQQPVEEIKFEDEKPPISQKQAAIPEQHQVENFDFETVKNVIIGEQITDVEQMKEVPFPLEKAESDIIEYAVFEKSFEVVQTGVQFQDPNSSEQKSLSPDE